eukprot:gb/GEZJ01004158.1/.p1 GENE.gb/GEZJ01004158.1/~~gb/GEZJ01004158.1/.p1  ORF type:complete len:528 (-),score=72.42 gb/GEZJ01004158.1/:267-1850(-)
MTLNLREIERGIGIDLLRRPVLTATVNAFLLRLFVDAFLQPTDEDDQDAHSTAYKHQDDVGCADSALSEKLAASAIFLLTHLVQLIGLAESAVWAVIAVVYKAIKLPRVYGFEKLVLDLLVLLAKPSVYYVKKTLRFQCRPGQKVPHLQLTRSGYGRMVITVVSSTESLTRDTRALLQMLRYVNYSTVAFWTEDSVVMVGVNKPVERALCHLGSEPIRIDLGWHKDVVEGTNFKVEAVFTKEHLRVVESGIQSVGRRAVIVELCAELRTTNLELLVKSMGQFAAVCEAYERGLRLFNGKRVTIYVVGLALCVALIVFYDGLPGLLQPSVDVLPLAIGAFTLWMTLGKSAALGETEEETIFTPHTSENVLLAYHGLARIEPHVRNVCWVPEVHREPQAPDVADGGDDGGEGDGGVDFDYDEQHDKPYELRRRRSGVDGSLSVLEAAVCLSIFEHYGNFVKWKGSRLRIDLYHVRAGPTVGLAHIVGVQRIRSLAAMRLHEHAPLVRHLGAPAPAHPALPLDHVADAAV